MEHELSKYSNYTNNEKIIYKDLSYKNIEACFEVHNSLGPGFSENIYEQALSIELKNKNIKFEQQKLIEVHYKDEYIGEYKLDLIIDDKIILELKAISEMHPIFEMQLQSYLKATGLKLGILVNFGEKKVKFKRILN